jgi:uncharacterized protein
MRLLATRYIKPLLFLLCFWFYFDVSYGVQKAPKYSHFVNDYAGVLGKQNEAMLNRLLQDFKDTIGVEIAVVIEPSSEYDVFDRAMFIARSWKVGEKGVNNGVLIYMNLEARKFHMVSADQTQGVLTDAFLGDIGQTYFVPFLKQGDYYQAIRETTYAIAIALRGEFKGRTKNKNSRESETPIGGVVLMIILAILYALFIRRGGGGGYSRRGYYTPPLFFGGGFSGRGFGGGGSSGGFGGFGGGGGFNGGGAGGSW